MKYQGWFYWKPQLVWDFPEQKEIPYPLPRIDWANTQLKQKNGVSPKYPDFLSLRVSLFNCSRDVIKRVVNSFSTSGSAYIETDRCRDHISGGIEDSIEFYLRNNGAILVDNKIVLCKEILESYDVQPTWLHVHNPDFLGNSDLIAKEGTPDFPTTIADKIDGIGTNPLSGEPDKVWARVLTGDPRWGRRDPDGNLWQWITFERPGVYARFWY